MTRANKSIEVTPEQAAQRHDDELPLLDIRSSQERNLGFACDAQPCAPEEVFSLASLAANDGLSAGLIICAGGIRSRTLVEQLHAQGFTGFQSVKGGYSAWQEA
jgi:rhodanese-related sulfurtransferase